jgi:glutamate racemase
VQQPIAILDSGVGGLTVAKEVMRQLPKEKIVYFGDTARAPYGPRPASDVLLFTRQIVNYLMQFEPKMVVIACNTATAVAIDDIRASVAVPVIGVIQPGARAALMTTRTRSVGVIGTDGTIQSGAYEKALRGLAPDIRVAGLACPLLVPLVEQGLFDTEEAYDVVRASLMPIQHEVIDCLILGCTHYPFLTPVIQSIMGPEVTLISSAEETAREIQQVLTDRGLLAQMEAKPIHQFLCSGDPDMFRPIAQRWLKEWINVIPVVWQMPHIV